MKREFDDGLCCVVERQNGVEVCLCRLEGDRFEEGFFVEGGDFDNEVAWVKEMESRIK
nr:MAG TPA: hypothetical protein [Caudoviricetes sp.]